MGRINKIIKILIVEDFFFNSGWGFLAPIFAIFIIQNVAVKGPEEAAKVAGFATFIFWIVKSLLQIPIGHYLDRNHGEKDDFWFSVLGLIVIALVPLGYLVSFNPWHIYLLQVVYAIGSAMLIPAWLAIFTRHIDKGKEAFEWGLESTTLGIGVGIAGAAGGLLAALFGFRAVFLLVSLMNFASVWVFTFIYKHISLENVKTIRAYPLETERPHT